MEKLNQLLNQLNSELSMLSNEELLNAVTNPKYVDMGHIITAEVLRRMAQPKIIQGYVEEKSSHSFQMSQSTLFDVDEKKKVHKKLNKEQLHEILTLMSEQETNADIAMAYDIHISYMGKLLNGEMRTNEIDPKFNPIVYRKNMYIINSVKKLPRKDINNIKDLLSNGVSSKVIATRYHLKQLSVGLIKSYMEGRKKAFRGKK